MQKYLVTLLFANVLIALATWGALALLGLAERGDVGRDHRRSARHSVRGRGRSDGRASASRCSCTREASR